MPMSKLIDFGLATKMDRDGKGTALMKCGTLGYMAPELNNGLEITPALDMWSFGICLYEMSTAYKPTAVRNFSYGSGPLPFLPRDWRKRNKQLQHLITACMEMDPNERISAYDALNHPWFTE